MATIPVQPFVLRDTVFTVDADNYEAATSAVTFVPSTTTGAVSFKGLTPTSSHSFPTSEPSTWVCNVEYAQDWETATSLANYLHDNEGQEVPVTFKPENGGPSFTATLTVVPGTIGGTVDQVATSSVSLPCTKPVRVPAA